MTNEDNFLEKFTAWMEQQNIQGSIIDEGGNQIDGPREIVRYLWKKLGEWWKKLLT